VDPKTTEKQVKQLRRFILGDLAFRQAASLCTYAELHALEITVMLYGPIVAGVCVTYMKPFDRASAMTSGMQEQGRASRLWSLGAQLILIALCKVSEEVMTQTQSSSFLS
jgi:hypothetical protein